MKTTQKIFIREEALKKLLPLIYISDELKNYIRTRYIAEKELGSFENYFQHILLNVCHYHIQNAYTLALLNKKACIDLSDRSKMLFNIGLQDVESKDDIVLVCALNHGKYEFSKWMKKRNCTNQYCLNNPLIVPKSFWEAFESEICECSPTGHFITDHNDRLPRYINKIELLSAFGKSWHRAVKNYNSIRPIVYRGAVQYAVPIYFDDFNDTDVVAICQLVKKEYNESRFKAITKMTKDMIRHDMLLTIFNEEKNSWLNPVSDSVMRERCLVCLNIPKKKKNKQSILKAIAGGIAPFMAGVALFILKEQGRKKFF